MFRIQNNGALPWFPLRHSELNTESRVEVGNYTHLISDIMSNTATILGSKVGPDLQGPGAANFPPGGFRVAC